MKRRGLFVSNLPYVLWIAFYFFVFWALLTKLAGCTVLEGFYIAFLVYAVSIPLALSSIGEALFRVSEGIRPIATRKEQEYLYPLFDEVYAQAKSYTPNISRDIQLYISDNLYPNAFALGRNTVAVTKGLIESMPPEQVKAIIGHELGHIVHGDTKAIVLKFIGNGIFSICVLMARLFVKILMFISRVFQIGIIFGLMFSLVFLALIPIALAVNIVAFLLKQIGDLILMAVSRQNEYFADEYAYSIGYGDELISSLYDLQNMSSSRKVSILEQLKSSHPYLSSRIQRLEVMDNGAIQNADRVRTPSASSPPFTSAAEPDVETASALVGTSQPIVTKPVSLVCANGKKLQVEQIVSPKSKLIPNEYIATCYPKTQHLPAKILNIFIQAPAFSSQWTYFLVGDNLSNGKYSTYRIPFDTYQNHKADLCRNNVTIIE